MNGIQISLGNLPLTLQLFNNGLLSIVRVANFNTIIDQPEIVGVSAIFDNNGFIIGNDNYEYGHLIEYKHIPDVLNWLQQQNIQNPFM